jgi:hypothetical protein
MTVKEIAIQTIDKLPNEVVFDDILEAIYIRAKFDMGADEIRKGKGIPHNTGKKMLLKWVK